LAWLGAWRGGNRKRGLSVGALVVNGRVWVGREGGGGGDHKEGVKANRS